MRSRGSPWGSYLSLNYPILSFPVVSLHRASPAGIRSACSPRARLHQLVALKTALLALRNLYAAADSVELASYLLPFALLLYFLFLSDHSRPATVIIEDDLHELLGIVSDMSLIQWFMTNVRPSPQPAQHPLSIGRLERIPDSLQCLSRL